MSARVTNLFGSLAAFAHCPTNSVKLLAAHAALCPPLTPGAYLQSGQGAGGWQSLGVNFVPGQLLSTFRNSPSRYILKVASSNEISGTILLTDTYKINATSFVTIPISEELRNQLIRQPPRFM